MSALPPILAISKGRNHRRRLEDPIQESIVTYLRLALPDDLVFSIPNEAVRSARLGAAMKRRGLRPGIPDLCIVQANTSIAHFMEVKQPGKRLNVSQRNMANYMLRMSIPRVTVTSVSDAETAIKHWGLLL